MGDLCQMKMIIYKAGDADSHKQLGKALAELPPAEYVVQIKKNRSIRSLQANKYYHVILNIIGISSGHSHDELHEICKLKFNSHMIDLPKGGSHVIGKTTTDLDTIEFAGYVNRVKQWAQDEWGITIPEARDIDYARWMEIENTYNENFSGF